MNPRLNRVGALLNTLIDDSRKLDVWIDGDCELCQRSRAWCEDHDVEGRVRFNDFRSVGVSALPKAYEDHEASMWVRDGNGELLEGFAAWRRIMADLPGWKWLARIASLPPLTLIGPPLYRLVAANRRRQISPAKRGA
jgi:predicted DCC family thiol-disulfide oxidoreductase YuxK